MGRLNPKEFMDSIDRRWRAESGLEHRGHYSIFYSLPKEHPILWLGQNPAGEFGRSPNTKILSNEELLSGRSEFIDGDGDTSRNTGQFLLRLCGNVAKVRRVQGSNVIWHRSPNADSLVDGNRYTLDPLRAATMAAPFITEIIGYVRPQVILVGGRTGFKWLKAALKPNKYSSRLFATFEHLQGEDVSVGWGRSIPGVECHRAHVYEQRMEVLTIVVPHLSRGVRDVVVEGVRGVLQRHAPGVFDRW